MWSQDIKGMKTNLNFSLQTVVQQKTSQNNTDCHLLVVQRGFSQTETTSPAREFARLNLLPLYPRKNFWWVFNVLLMAPFGFSYRSEMILRRTRKYQDFSIDDMLLWVFSKEKACSLFCSSLQRTNIDLIISMRCFPYNYFLEGYCESVPYTISDLSYSANGTRMISNTN